ncbi:para-nitrobenzyl esterase [Variovorax sp. PDC80]|uniref:carboxylesterase/lipase family protein n=1 Tax=Variovorax sp. PDC80 TaxID=1882827 RepID=UPI0008E50BB2|nr:carboxylesterase family protein [Variovorax sp. PDC80]SFO06995.1 para-nitrobenzyl esterase [Variovorax sp. PDC80]
MSMKKKTFPLRRFGIAGAVAAVAALAACGGGDGGAVVAFPPVSVAPPPPPPAAPPPAAHPLQVATTYGEVEGAAQADGAAYAWLGIPYAQPPVGERRWKPPVSPNAWSGVRSAKDFGRSCAQAGSFYAPPLADDGFTREIGTSFGQLVGAEDCLTLNVWRPATQEKNLPVVVWVHGGANTVGYTHNPTYDGVNFARSNNAIVVTVNYRLGVFGWFRHPALRSGDAVTDSGNYGTLDLAKALEFVHANVAAFGGDPRNVTLMGQSAGAWNTYAMILTPLSKGKDWFQKAVPMSMGVKISSTAQADTYAKGVVRKLLVMTGAATEATVDATIAGMSEAQVASLLRNAPASQLALLSSGQADNIGDGTVLPAVARTAVEAGEYRKVPLLAGTTRDEGKMFLQSYYQVDDATRFLMMYDFDPNRPTAPGSATLASVLKPGVTVDAYNAAGKAVTAASFAASITSALTLFQAHQPEVYAYRFDWSQGPEPWNTLYGAGHSTDIPFMFGNFGKGMFSMNYTDANRPGREALSAAMMGSVGAFMKTGNPNHAGLGVEWVRWTPAGTPRRLLFDATASEKRIVLE